MAKEKNHIVNSKDYQRYLHGQMTSKERHNFENSLLEDGFENEAFEGLSQLKPDELSEDLNSLGDRLISKTRKRNSFLFWRIAASILLLSLFSFLVYYLIDSNTKKEIAQSKEIPTVEKTDKTQYPSLTHLDSSEMDSDQIIAYQQNLDEESIDNIVPEESRKSFNRAKSEEEPSQEALLEIADAEEESEEMVMDDVEVDPILSLAEAKKEQPQADLELFEQIEEIVSNEPLSQVSAMKKGAASSQSRMAVRNKNLRTITGKVMSLEDDEVIPGVNINVKGTDIGTISDFDGNYTIAVPKDEEITLVFSSVGYLSEEIKVENHETIDANIEPDISALSEIVVVDYGVSSNYQKPEYAYTPPKPVGGNGKFKDYVKENIRYPESGLEDKIKGTVKLKLTIDRNGKISNVEVLKSLGREFDKEAIRLINEGPKWEPARENDSTIVKDVKVKIRFRAPE